MTETPIEQVNETQGAEFESGQSERASKPLWIIPVIVIACVLIGLLGEYLVGRYAANAMMVVEGRFQHMYFPAPHGQLGDPPEWLIERRVSMMKNNAIAYGAFATILLATVGLILGIAYNRRNPITGLLIGGFTGLLAGAVFAPICYYIEDTIRSTDMEGALKASIVLGLVFLSFGLAGAIVTLCAGPVKGVGRALLNGLLAAIISLVVYLLFAIAVFPIGFPESMHPLDAGVRYTLFVCLGICPGLATLLLVLSSPKAKTEN